MSRTITVRIVDHDGYGKAGYRVTTYSGDSAKTDSDGECSVKVSGSDEIYLEGAKIAGGGESDFKSTIIYKM